MKLLRLAILVGFCFSTDIGNAQNVPSPAISFRAQNLAAAGWTNSSFAEGIDLIADRNETKESRAVAIEVLHANRRKLEAHEMTRFLDEVTTIAKDPAADETLASLGVRTMGNLALTMEELGKISSAEAKKEAHFLMVAATNTQRSVHFRASAIITLGILKITEASVLLHGILGESASMDVPEISRPACLSLMRIDGEAAIPTLAQVLRKTANSRVFGTAAFAIAQIKKPVSMVVLVENLERFPDTGSCDAALVDMEGVISSILEKPNDPDLLHAVWATRHLWREGQRDHYIPLLRRLLTTASQEVRRASLDRLLEEASELEFEREKQDLASILEVISDQPEFIKYEERIRQRLSAKLLTPVSSNGVTVPTDTEERR